MRKVQFSIRTTLLLVIGMLTLLVATLTGLGVYRALLNEEDARVLKRGSALLNTIYNAQKCLSFERSASVAILYASPENTGALLGQIQTNRACEATYMAQAMAHLHRQKAEGKFASEIQGITMRVAALERGRFELDQALIKPLRYRRFDLSDNVFTTTTMTITSVQALITAYSSSLYSFNPTAAQQLHFKYYVWQLAEYAGREYALVGKLIVQDRPPTRDQQIDLVSWRGRIDAGWELSHEYAALGGLDDKLHPLIEEAESQYLKTFDQIRGMFFGPQPVSVSRHYPITINAWLKNDSRRRQRVTGVEGCISVRNAGTYRRAGEARRKGRFISTSLSSFARRLSASIRSASSSGASSGRSTTWQTRFMAKAASNRRLRRHGKEISTRSENYPAALDTFRAYSAQIEISSRELRERRKLSRHGAVDHDGRPDRHRRAGRHPAY